MWNNAFYHAQLVYPFRERGTVYSINRCMNNGVKFVLCRPAVCVNFSTRSSVTVQYVWNLHSVQTTIGPTSTTVGPRTPVVGPERPTCAQWPLACWAVPEHINNSAFFEYIYTCVYYKLCTVWYLFLLWALVYSSQNCIMYIVFLTYFRTLLTRETCTVYWGCNMLRLH